MRFVITIISLLALIGCTTPYEPLQSSIPSANLDFQLLTSSTSSVKGTLKIGTSGSCKASELLTSFNLGNKNQDVKNKYKAKIPSNGPIVLRAFVDDNFSSCRAALKFTPTANTNYFSTFEYSFNECKLSVFELDADSNQIEIDVSKC